MGWKEIWHGCSQRRATQNQRLVQLVLTGGITMMLNKLSEEDFVVLRGTLECGRRRPSALGRALILGTSCQAPFLLLVSYIRNYSTYPHKEKMFTIHLVLSCILIIFYII